MKHKCTLIYISSILFAFMLFFTINTSWAGGLYINEFGTPSMGVAGAGA